MRSARTSRAIAGIVMAVALAGIGSTLAGCGGKANGETPVSADSPETAASGEPGTDLADGANGTESGARGRLRSDTTVSGAAKYDGTL
jgi:hypothetical protein